MSLLILQTPIAGQSFSSEGAKVANDMTAIQTLVNGNLDAINLANAVMATYTPTWTASVTNPTLGNGTLAGHYFAIGKCVLVRIYLAIGSTTTLGSGNWALTVPVAPKSDSSYQILAGMVGSGTNFIPLLGQLFAGTSSVALWAGGQPATPSSPVSWVSGNVIALQGVYESA